MIAEELLKRKLPEVLKCNDGSCCASKERWLERRQEIRDLLCSCFGGYSPGFPTTVEGVVLREDVDSYGGKAVTYELEIRSRSPFSYFTFPCKLAVPKAVSKPSVFVYLAFSPVIADGLGEEILDQGFAIASVYYQDIAADREDDFLSGAGRFCSRNRFNSWGKLGMWAWGASRIMDYLQTLDIIDRERITIFGFSRLGKAALWCGAMDERFSMVAANDSGGGGAALFRGKIGEKIKNLENKGSNCWFCGNFFEYSNREEELPFDMHYLLSMVAPRNLYISSASQDDWADPVSEFLACAATDPIYSLLGERGLVTEDRLPEKNECLHEGKIGYHLRAGTHYLSRYDWQKLMEYRRKHNV